MVVRIRLGRARRAGERKKKYRVAAALAALSTPIALMAAVLGLWGIAADFHWTGSFAIPSGVFSHWQFWIGAAALLQYGSHLLNRYGKSGKTAPS
jgi:hypothetical protein